MRIKPDLVAVDRYCPDCGRMIYHAFEDGKSGFAPNTVCVWECKMDEHGVPSELFLVDVRCLPCQEG